MIKKGAFTERNIVLSLKALIKTLKIIFYCIILLNPLSYRSSHPWCPVKKVPLKTGKHLGLTLSYSLQLYLKRDSDTCVFL